MMFICDNVVRQMYVKKVMTFKSGKFVFSRKFSLRELLPLRIEARILYDAVSDLPILPKLATALEQELIRRSIFGTAAIEGNPLTEERVGQIISESKSVGVPGNAEIEIRNLKNAYDFTKTLKRSDSSPIIGEDLIKKAHALITTGVQDEYNNPGMYRNHIVKVGDKNHGGVYTPPKCLEDIRNLMKEYEIWINSDEVVELDQPIRAALAHFHLGLIHPFGNGNGRTARLIEALLLQLSGIKYVPVMLSNFYYRNMDDYFWAFSKSERNKENDITPFLSLALKGFIESLKEIKGKITFYIRLFSLRDYYAYLREERLITQRQHDFLVLLLDYREPFVLKDLFSVNPFSIMYRQVSERTARRDLAKLKDMELLSVTNDKKYDLNWEVLG